MILRYERLEKTKLIVEEGRREPEVVAKPMSEVKVFDRKPAGKACTCSSEEGAKSPIYQQRPRFQPPQDATSLIIARDKEP